MKTYKDSLNAANPNNLADLLREFKLGDLLRALPVQLTKQDPAAGSAANGNLTTVDVIHLPDDAKAAVVLRASARAGSVTGELTPVAYGTSPATTQIAVTPNGDIATNQGTDAISDLDLLYVPAKGDVYEFEGNLATGVLTIPPEIVARGVLMLLEAEITAGAAPGDKIILVPVAGAGLPAAGRAQLTSNKSTVSFNNASDAGTAARVKLLVAPAVDANAKFAEAAKY